ncbi:group 1 truncated hemoglobin [Pseudomonadota bacterium]
MAIDKTLFKRLGGKPTLERVHKIFYDAVYAHPWLKQYFTDKPQLGLEEQQTAFMGYLMGGPNLYVGKTPKVAHQHMVISEELFELRSQLLSDAIKEAGISDALREEWLAADAALKKSISKTAASDCVRAYPTQEILDFPKPR